MYPDKSAISYEVSDWTTLTSLEVSLLKSDISVLRVLNTIDDKSLTSLLNASLKSFISVESVVK